MAKQFSLLTKRRFASQLLRAACLIMLLLPAGCEVHDFLTYGNPIYPEKVELDFKIQVKEFGTNIPIAEALAIAYFHDVGRVEKRTMENFRLTATDSGVLQLKGLYYPVSSMSIHKRGYFYQTYFGRTQNGHVDVVYLKPYADLILHFDFALLAAKEPDSLFDYVRYTIGDVTGVVNSSRTTPSMRFNGNQEVVVVFSAYKQNTLVMTWENSVYLPGKQTTVHTVTLGHDK